MRNIMRNINEKQNQQKLPQTRCAHAFHWSDKGRWHENKGISYHLVIQSSLAQPHLVLHLLPGPRRDHLGDLNPVPSAFSNAPPKRSDLFELPLPRSLSLQIERVARRS